MTITKGVFCQMFSLLRNSSTWSTSRNRVQLWIRKGLGTVVVASRLWPCGAASTSTPTPRVRSMSTTCTSSSTWRAWTTPSRTGPKAFRRVTSLSRRSTTITITCLIKRMCNWQLSQITAAVSRTITTTALKTSSTELCLNLTGWGCCLNCREAQPSRRGRSMNRWRQNSLSTVKTMEHVLLTIEC